MRDNGHVYMGTYEGWYCPKCADFKAENEVDDGELCPIHHIKLTREQEDNYFFALSQLPGASGTSLCRAPRLRRPPHPLQRGALLHPVRPARRAASRHKLTWGVPVPWDPTHVFYVWFDALLNYYSALSYARDDEDLAPTFWPADVHLIAKDILRFHAVYWPALLMAAGLELPHKLFVHGYLLMDGEKMSKSLGNVLDPFAVIDRFGADALRFYLLRDVSFGQDGSVSTASFEQRYESELANDYGNLASRTLAMIVRYRDGVVAGGLDEALGGRLRRSARARRRAARPVELTNALDEIWQRVRRLNRYVEEQAPWQLAKDPGRADDLDRVLATLVEGMRVVSVLLHPYLPDATAKLLAALGAPDVSYDRAGFGGGEVERVEKVEALFPKRDADEPAAVSVA